MVSAELRSFFKLQCLQVSLDWLLIYHDYKLFLTEDLFEIHIFKNLPINLHPFTANLRVILEHMNGLWLDTLHLLIFWQREYEWRIRVIDLILFLKFAIFRVHLALDIIPAKFLVNFYYSRCFQYRWYFLENHLNCINLRIEITELLYRLSLGFLLNYYIRLLLTFRYKLIKSKAYMFATWCFWIFRLL